MYNSANISLTREKRKALLFLLRDLNKRISNETCNDAPQEILNLFSESGREQIRIVLKLEPGSYLSYNSYIKYLIDDIESFRLAITEEVVETCRPPTKRITYPYCLSVGDKVYINFCDTSATVDYGSFGVVEKDENGNLYVANGIRKDYVKDMDGCYTFLTKN